VKRLAFALLVCAVTAHEGTADAPAPIRLRSLFPKEAGVVVEKAGMTRLALPADVVGACRADLSDLRLLDASGNEIPFVLDRGLEANAKVEIVESAVAAVLDVSRDEVRRADGPSLYREAYRLALPEAPPQSGQWKLTVKTARPRFVRRLNVAAVGDDGALASLLENAPLFRLPELPAWQNQRVSFVLPAFPGNRLAVTLEGEDGAYLEPSFSLDTTRSLETAKPLVVPLEEVARRSERGRTTVDFARPSGLLPDSLRLETVTPWFQRRISVRDRLRDRDTALLGDAELYRFRDVPGVEALELPLRRAAGDRLRVEVLDGDSPPLDQLGFAAIVRQYSILFFAPESAAGPVKALLVFGGGRADRPRYDLSGLMPPDSGRLSVNQTAIALYLRDPSRVALARLEEPRDNPQFDRTPALAFAMRPAAEVDRRLYTHRREIALTPSAEGVARLRLSPEEAAVAREDLADVRVVDAEGRQWPYLLGRDEPSEERALPFDGPNVKERSSHYRFRLPASPVRIERLNLEADEAFIDRAFRVVAARRAESGVEEHVAKTGRLVRRAGDRSPLQISLPPERMESLELVVDDGNEAPLRLRNVRATIPDHEIFVTAPAGPYFLLLGNVNDQLPRYDLAAVRDVVLAVGSAPVPGGPLVKNPDYSARAQLSLRKGLDEIFFWIVLTLAVVVLGGITLRLARETPPAGD
jgi:hypothetical protein